MKIPFVMLCLGFTIPDLAQAQRVIIECPKTIAVNETLTANYPSWESLVDKGNVAYSLQAIRIYSGHPSELANLMPTGSSRANGKQITTWQLRPDPMGYWVACAYGNAMTILTKRLPAAVKTCQLVEKLLPAGALAGTASLTCE